MLRMVLATMILLAAATAARAQYDEQAFVEKAIPTYTIPTPAPGSVAPLIGQARVYRIRKGDTLMDLARLFDLGYNEIVEANPYIDAWVPPVGVRQSSRPRPTGYVVTCVVPGVVPGRM